MGSSPGGDYRPPARQGPPIEQLNPAQGPPSYPSFINGTGPQTGLTPEMLAAIAANQGPGPQIYTPPPPAPAAPPGPNRQQLAQVMARQQMQQQAQQYNRERGGGSSR